MMATDTTSRPTRLKSRKSIAHVSSVKDLESDKENATTDLGSIRQRKPGGSAAERKKLRSKSLGPGGLEALKQTAGNAIKVGRCRPQPHCTRAKHEKTPSPPRIKSILKPTVPWTPPKAIPAFDESRKRSASRSAGRGVRKSPRRSAGEGLLIDFSTPVSDHPAPTVTGIEYIQDPFSPLRNVAAMTMDAEEVGAKEKEAEAARKLQKEAILDQRAARRKSMASRRVSFAPEATLHTWNVVEMVEDSTSSSASNSTRRQSSATTTQASHQTSQNQQPGSDPSEAPSTPPDQVESPLVKASPTHERDLHQQRRRRRSSAVSPGQSDAVDENDSSAASIYSGSSEGGDSSPIHVEDSIHSSSDEDGDTAMSMDDATGQTIQSEVSGSSTGSSLDERLRKAAAEAGTRGITYDESGEDLSMELAEGTITNAFQPWVNGQSRAVGKAQNASAMMDQENVNPFSPAFKRQADVRASLSNGATEQEVEDMTMDMTVAGGGLMSVPPRDTTTDSKLKTDAIEEDEEAEDMEMDVTMDMTVVGGGVLEQQLKNVPVDDKATRHEMQDRKLEDVTMNITATESSVLSPETGDMTMDMTVAGGGVVDSEPEDQAMDMTVVGGSIMPRDPTSDMSRPQISLHDFLEMTNIHFIELSAAKRRHTGAPSIPTHPSSPSSDSAAACVAAVTTLPLLELYQHATRELKSYIETGREVIQSIEQETAEEQPALFREYVEARPDVRMVMDNQFRNGKANARLQGKEGWYEWRTKLAEGLKRGLHDIRAGMEDDANVLTQQENILQDTVPVLVRNLSDLKQKAQILQQRAQEFEGIDHESLSQARGQLEVIDQEVGEKAALLDQLQREITDKTDGLSAAAELKTEFQEQIAEAERVLDECRGWKVEEVKRLKEQVTDIETRTSWRLVNAEHEVDEGDYDFGPALTMVYHDSLRLFFHPAAFQNGIGQEERRRSRRSKSDSRPSAPLSLTYASPEGKIVRSTDLATQQRFFLQFLQGHLHSLAASPKGSLSAQTMLAVVGEGWQLCEKITTELRLLDIAGITSVSILSDEKLRANCKLIMPENCRVDVSFTLTVHAESQVNTFSSFTVDAYPRYGSATSHLNGTAKASKVREALDKQANSHVLGEGVWAASVRGLEEWLLQQDKTVSQKELHPTAGTTPTAAATAKEVLEQPSPIETPRTPTPAAPALHMQHRRGLKRPVPMEEVMEEAAARHHREKLRKQQQQQKQQQQEQEQEQHQQQENKKEVEKKKTKKKEESKGGEEDEEEVRRRHEEEEFSLASSSLSPRKTPTAPGRRPGALRRSP